MRKTSYLLLALLFYTGCASGPTFYRTAAQVTAAPGFTFEPGQRIALLPVVVSGHPTIKADPTTTAAFAVHLTKLGYQVYEVDQLRAESKRMGVTLPDSITVSDYPLITQGTGIRQVLQANLDYVFMPSQSYSTTPSQPSTIVATNNPFAIGLAAGSAREGSSMAVGETFAPRSESISLIDAQSSSVLARGFVGAGNYSMSEQLAVGLYNIIASRQAK